MASETRTPTRDSSAAARATRVLVDADGVRTSRTGRGRTAVWLIALAVMVPVVATIVAVALIRHVPAKPAAPGSRAANDTARSDDAAPNAAPLATVAPRAEKLIPRRVAGIEQVAPAIERPDARPTREPKKKPELGAAEVITALRENGETGGIAAFPLPGTKPIKPGIVVPEEMELPEGYVRHYQTTDDGKQLPAILMFHPDYQFVNAHGEPVEIPADRIVPPDMAPEGMHIEMLEPGATDAPP